MALRQYRLVLFYAPLEAAMEDNKMSIDSSSNTYHEAATEFIQQIRQHSPSAADCIEQIQAQYGTRAAYLAAFALVYLKHSQIAHKYNPSQRELYLFTYCEEMRECAEAIRLYEDAAAHLMPGINRTDG